MPTFEKSSNTRESSSKHETGGNSKFFAIYGNPGSGNATPAARASRTDVIIKTTASYEHLLYSLPSGMYQKSAGCSVTDLFYPYQTQIGPVVSGMPCFASGINPQGSGTFSTSGFISLGDQLPFDWNPTDNASIYDRNILASGDSMSYLISSESYYGNTDKYRDRSNIRSIGIRLPAMAVGWGYTTDGKPYPNVNTGTPSGSLFKGGYSKGWQVDPNDYIAAPIDLRYDALRNVWTATGASNGIPNLIACNVTQDGGSTSGNLYQQPDLTYTVKDFYNITLYKDNGTTPATGMSPAWGRPVGLYVKATKGTYYRDINNNMILYQVNEMPSVSGC